MHKPDGWQRPNLPTFVIVLLICIGALYATTRSPVGRDPALKYVKFREVSHAAGLAFVHSKLSFDPRVSNIMPWLSSVGASASAADFDNSGLVSVFFTNSSPNSQNALFRNDRIADGVPRFHDVTAEVGLLNLNTTGASLAAAWGDYDNDGYPDLYIVRAGAPNKLFHNVPVLDANSKPALNAQGRAVRTFVDVTDSSGTGNLGYGVGALWFDFDRDGRLDLLVADYFPSYYDRATHTTSPYPTANSEFLDLWHLQTTRFMAESFNDAANGGGVLLYHNDGGGHFTEIHKEAGLTHTGWALALGTADLNNDEWPDIYVANDFGPDDLYMNVSNDQNGRRFARVQGGFTADKVGRDTKKGMNVDFGDIDHNGSLSIYVTNITQEKILPEGNMLWIGRNDPSRTGGRNYDNRAEKFRVEDCGWGWAAKFADVNNDGWQDLFVANGFISASTRRSYWYELQDMVSDYRTILADAASWPAMNDKSLSGYERSCLYVRDGNQFIDMAKSAGVTDTYDGRGVAVADFNNDGAIDFIVSNQGQPALLYLNDLYQQCNQDCPAWTGFRLKANGTSSNLDAIGSRIELDTNEGLQVAEVSRGNGFASQNDPRIHFGLGRETRVNEVRVRWPDGKMTRVPAPRSNTYLEVDEDVEKHD